MTVKKDTRLAGLEAALRAATKAGHPEPSQVGSGCCLGCVARAAICQEIRNEIRAERRERGKRNG